MTGRAGLPRSECAACRTKADALASGFNPMMDGGWQDFVDDCDDPDCRWYVAPVVIDTTQADTVRFLQRAGLYVQ